VRADLERYYHGLRDLADRYMRAAQAEAKRRGRHKNPKEQSRTLGMATRAVTAAMQAGRHWAIGGTPVAAPKDPLAAHLGERGDVPAYANGAQH
jgi:hypothetical protein